jgi:hypothetical protein
MTVGYKILHLIINAVFEGRLERTRIRQRVSPERESVQKRVLRALVAR